MSIRVLFVQVPDDKDGGWKTIFATPNKNFATFLADHFNGRAVSKTNLKNIEGLPGVRKATHQARFQHIPPEEMQELNKRFSGDFVETKEYLLTRIPIDFFKKIELISRQRGIPVKTYMLEALHEKLERENNGDNVRSSVQN